MPRKIPRGPKPKAPNTGVNTTVDNHGGDPDIKVSNLIRVATRLETVPLGEPLYSEYPSALKRPLKEKPFVDLNFEKAQIVQVRLPMRLRVHTVKGRREKTQITLLAANDMSIDLEDLKHDNTNLEELDKYASYEIEGASLATIEVNPLGGAGLFEDDITTRRLRVGDVAAWFSTELSSLRSQMNIWNPPNYSAGSLFNGKFPESPWGIWFSNKKGSIPAPIFTWNSMEEYLQTEITADYDYSQVPQQVVSLFNPSGEAVRVYSESFSAGWNYKFIDRPLKISKREGQIVHTVPDPDVEAKALTKYLMDKDAGIPHILA